jgi:hypothetical protein
MMNCELEGSDFGLIEIMPRHFPGRMWKPTESLSQDRRFLRRNSNWILQNMILGGWELWNTTEIDLEEVGGDGTAH